jgi:hypothetical protein
MPDAVTCKFCGATNPVGRQNCYKCGAWQISNSSIESQPVTSSFSQTPADVKPSPSRPAPSASAFYYEEEKGVLDTDRGLLMLALGIFIGSLPIIGLLGSILALIGAIFVIIGRDAFSKTHANYVVTATILYAISLVSLFIISASIGPSVGSILETTTDPSSVSTQLTNLINGYIVAIVALAIITGLSTVLFTYAIQNGLGRVLLWLSLGISLLLLIPVLGLASQLPQLINQAITTSDPSPLYSWLDQIQAFSWLKIIPAIFYALAYLNARAVISSGDIQ